MVLIHAGPVAIGRLFSGTKGWTDVTIDSNREGVQSVNFFMVTKEKSR
jgi:hypothetical protein